MLSQTRQNSFCAATSLPPFYLGQAMRFTRSQMNESRAQAYQKAMNRYRPMHRTMLFFFFLIGMFVGIMLHLFLSVIAKGASTWPIL